MEGGGLFEQLSLPPLNQNNGAGVGNVLPSQHASIGGESLGSGRGGADNKSQGSLLRNRSPDTNKQPKSPMLKRGGRGVDSGAIQDLAQRMIQFEEAFFGLEARVDSIKKSTDEKMGKDDVIRLNSDKVTKDEIQALIPNEEILQEKMKYIIRDEIDNLQNKFMEQLKLFDNKLVRLR